jgi:hypothetical protein
MGAAGSVNQCRRAAHGGHVVGRVVRILRSRPRAAVEQSTDGAKGRVGERRHRPRVSLSDCNNYACNDAIVRII